MKLNEDYIEQAGVVNTIQDDDSDIFPYYIQCGTSPDEYYPPYAIIFGLQYKCDGEVILKWLHRQIRLITAVFNLFGLPDYALKIIRYTRGIKNTVLDPKMLLSDEFHSSVECFLDPMTLTKSKMFYLMFGFSIPKDMEPNK